MASVDASDLIAELKASLLSSADYFQGTDSDADADFKRHLQVAAADLAEHRNLTLLGEFELEADQADYTDVPADLVRINSALWGTEKRLHPWADNYPGPLPRARLSRTSSGQRISLAPAPTRTQILTLGSTYRFYYAASYWTGSTSDPLNLDGTDRGLILLRAQAEACKELALMNVTRTVETRTSVSGPRNQTPRSLFEMLIAEYRKSLGVVA